MAEKDEDLLQGKEVNTEEGLHETLSKTEQVLEENKDLITKILTGVGVVILAFWALNSFYWGPAEEASKEQLWEAQYVFEKDSFANAASSLEEIVSNYASTDAGNAAQLYLGISKLNEKDFEGALEAFEDFSAAGYVMPALKSGLIGDCYSEMGEWEKAVSNYEKAAKNTEIKAVSAYFLKKAGILYEQNGSNEEAVSTYETILSKYLLKGDAQGNQDRKEIEKNLERAKSALK